jgi:hypothetical protein
VQICPEADFRSLRFSGIWFEILEGQESTHPCRSPARGEAIPRESDFALCAAAAEWGAVADGLDGHRKPRRAVRLD